MQMSLFREMLIKLSLKCISCSLKRRNLHVCSLNSYKLIFDKRVKIVLIARIYYKKIV